MKDVELEVHRLRAKIVERLCELGGELHELAREFPNEAMSLTDDPLGQVKTLVAECSKVIEHGLSNDLFSKWICYEVLLKAHVRNSALPPDDREPLFGVAVAACRECPWIVCWELYEAADSRARELAKEAGFSGDVYSELVLGKKQPPRKVKRSTVKNEARERLIAALTKHHEYARGGCLNTEAVGSNELARQANVTKGSASAFFKWAFKGHTRYKVVCRNVGRLAESLKVLNNGLCPWELYGRNPPNEQANDSDE